MWVLMSKRELNRIDVLARLDGGRLTTSAAADLIRLTIRKLAPKTQHDYLQRVKNFAAFLGRSPDTASFEDVRRYQLHLATSGAGVTLNQSVSTLRFFFKITLGRADIVNHTQFIHVPRKLPVVLSPEEVARFLDAAPGLKYKAALSVAYGAGLRVSEVVALKVSDIDSHGERAFIPLVRRGLGRWLKPFCDPPRKAKETLPSLRDWLCWNWLFDRGLDCVR
ncbi:tyrosine-type recombinase/integrase [Bradyrhizobium sp. AZCC 2289]|uniref:tyrosine-type recombinase/integrase n=1 Tax=Bradyrhizobium sp. AZCC 2289 TaxID=3117026 RepID=UPI002FF00564